MRGSEGAQSSSYLYPIDLLRLSVCLGIAIGHLASPALIGQLPSLVLNSGIGSSFFFLLSGYIVVSTKTYWRSVWREYAAGRFSRLWPVHIAGLILMTPCMLIGLDRMPMPQFLEGFVWRLAALDAVHAAFFGGGSSEWNGPAWSVTPLLFGGFLLPVWKWLGAQTWKNGAIAASLLGLFVLRLAITVAPPEVTTHEQVLARHVEPIQHILEILGGGLFAILLPRLRDGGLAQSLRSDFAFLVTLAVVIAPVAAGAARGESIGAYYVVHGPILPALLLFLAAASLNTGWVNRFSQTRFVKVGADLSLPIFLLHMPVGRLGVAVLKRVGITDQTIGEGPLVAILIAACVGLSYVLLPVMEKIRRLLTGMLTARQNGRSGALTTSEA